MRRLFLLMALVALASCATSAASRDQCAAGYSCQLTGTLTPAAAQGVDMGRMELANGECVAVSLPDPMLDTLFARGPYATTVSGRVFHDPGPERNVTQIIVNGRNVGSGMCGGGFFVYVY